MSSPSNLIECSVCLDSKEKQAFDYLPCFHSFCRVCIEKFRVRTCPLCRRPFGVDPSESRTQQAFSAPGRLEGHSLVTRTYVAVEHVEETPRARRRRRQPRRRDRRRQRPRDNRRDEIFHLEMDEILPENEEEEPILTEDKREPQRRRSNRRRDAYQQLRLQRNLRTS